MRKITTILFYFSFILYPAYLSAQGGDNSGTYIMKARIINGDTILVSELPGVEHLPVV